MPETETARTYCILRRAPQWVLCAGSGERPILCSENRDDLLRIACRLGLERSADVRLFDEHDGLEAKLSFKEGRFAIEGMAKEGSSAQWLWLEQLAAESMATPEAR